MDICAADVPFEEDCLRMPTVLRNWTRYINHLLESGAAVDWVRCVFDRAVGAIPYSHKLWRLYQEWSLTTGQQDLVRDVMQRAASELPRFPRVWLRYAEACVKCGWVEVGMWCLDHSLRHLPITQHERIWDFYKVHFCQLLSHRRDPQSLRMIVDIWHRWLQLHPDKRDHDYCESMVRLGCVDEAAGALHRLSMANDDNKALSRLLELLADNPAIAIHGVDSVIKAAIKRQPTRCGALWNVLSARAIQRQDYRTAQAIFEEALESIVSLEDFCLVFEAYSMFLETLCSALLGTERAGLYLAKLERLMAQRKFYLHNVLVRLQPSNVDFWLQRLELVEREYKDDLVVVIAEYERAVKSVNPRHTEKFYLLWMAFARVYCEHGEYETAFGVLDYAGGNQVRLQPEDHANLLIEYSKLKQKKDECMQILLRGCAPHSPSYKTSTFWNYLLDMQEAVALQQPTIDATCEPVKAVMDTYNKVIELRLATAQTFINYAEFVMLTTGDCNRQFAVYERGIAAFGWPIAFELWNVYLPKAVRVLPALPLGVERLRDLFEQALHKCPDHLAAPIVTLYCKLEEEHGLARNCLRILDAAVRRPLLSGQDRALLYKLLIARTKTLSGVPDLRAVYERALKSLPRDNLDYAVTVAIEWAHLEATMGEMVRCRSLLVHISEQAVRDERVWACWEALEQEHGDERSYRDMLRLKRAIVEKHAKRHGTLMSSFVPASTPGVAAGVAAGVDAGVDAIDHVDITGNNGITGITDTDT